MKPTLFLLAGLVLAGAIAAPASAEPVPEPGGGGADPPCTLEWESYGTYSIGPLQGDIELPTRASCY